MQESERKQTVHNADGDDGCFVTGNLCLRRVKNNLLVHLKRKPGSRKNGGGSSGGSGSSQNSSGAADQWHRSVGGRLDSLIGEIDLTVMAGKSARVVLKAVLAVSDSRPTSLVVGHVGHLVAGIEIKKGCKSARQRVW